MLSHDELKGFAGALDALIDAAESKKNPAKAEELAPLYGCALLMRRYVQGRRSGKLEPDAMMELMLEGVSDGMRRRSSGMLPNAADGLSGASADRLAGALFSYRNKSGRDDLTLTEEYALWKSLDEFKNRQHEKNGPEGYKGCTAQDLCRMRNETAALAQVFGFKNAYIYLRMHYLGDAPPAETLNEQVGEVSKAATKAFDQIDREMIAWIGRGCLPASPYAPSAGRFSAVRNAAPALALFPLSKDRMAALRSDAANTIASLNNPSVFADADAFKTNQKGRIPLSFLEERSQENASAGMARYESASDAAGRSAKNASDYAERVMQKAEQALAGSRPSAGADRFFLMHAEGVPDEAKEVCASETALQEQAPGASFYSADPAEIKDLRPILRFAKDRTQAALLEAAARRAVSEFQSEHYIQTLIADEAVLQTMSQENKEAYFPSADASHHGKDLFSRIWKGRGASEETYRHYAEKYAAPVQSDQMLENAEAILSYLDEKGIGAVLRDRGGKITVSLDMPGNPSIALFGPPDRQGSVTFRNRRWYRRIGVINSEGAFKAPADRQLNALSRAYPLTPDQALAPLKSFFGEQKRERLAFTDATGFTDGRELDAASFDREIVPDELISNVIERMRSGKNLPADKRRSLRSRQLGRAGRMRVGYGACSKYISYFLPDFPLHTDRGFAVEERGGVRRPVSAVTDADRALSLALLEHAADEAAANITAQADSQGLLAYLKNRADYDAAGGFVFSDNDFIREIQTRFLDAADAGEIPAGRADETIQEWAKQSLYAPRADGLPEIHAAKILQYLNADNRWQTGASLAEWMRTAGIHPADFPDEGGAENSIKDRALAFDPDTARPLDPADPAHRAVLDALSDNFDGRTDAFIDQNGLVWWQAEAYSSQSVKSKKDKHDSASKTALIQGVLGPVVLPGRDGVLPNLRASQTEWERDAQGKWQPGARGGLLYGLSASILHPASSGEIRNRTERTRAVSVEARIRQGAARSIAAGIAGFSGARRLSRGEFAALGADPALYEAYAGEDGILENGQFLTGDARSVMDAFPSSLDKQILPPGWAYDLSVPDAKAYLVWQKAYPLAKERGTDLTDAVSIDALLDAVFEDTGLVRAALGLSDGEVLSSEEAARIRDQIQAAAKFRLDNLKTAAKTLRYPSEYTDDLASRRNVQSAYSRPDGLNDPVQAWMGTDALGVFTDEGDGIFDPACGKHTDKRQGGTRMLIESAEVLPDGRIRADADWMEKPESMRCALYLNEFMEYSEYDPIDRQSMSAGNMQNAFGVRHGAKTAMLAAGLANQDDGIIITKAFSQSAFVPDADGNPRPLRAGDKLSDGHGNKGVISLVVDPDQENQPGVPEYLRKICADNKDLEVLISPLSPVSRFNAGTVKELTDGAHWDLQIGGKVYPDAVGELDFIVTDKTAESKSTIYEDAGGRKISAQIGWAMEMTGCEDFIAGRFSKNGAAFARLQGFMFAQDMRLEDDGKMGTDACASRLDAGGVHPDKAHRAHAPGNIFAYAAHTRAGRDHLFYDENGRVKERRAVESRTAGAKARRALAKDVLRDPEITMLRLPFDLKRPDKDQKGLYALADGASTDYILPLLPEKYRKESFSQDGILQISRHGEHTAGVLEGVCRYNSSLAAMQTLFFEAAGIGWTGALSAKGAPSNAPDETNFERIAGLLSGESDYAQPNGLTKQERGRLAAFRSACSEVLLDAAGRAGGAAIDREQMTDEALNALAENVLGLGKDKSLEILPSEGGHTARAMASLLLRGADTDTRMAHFEPMRPEDYALLAEHLSDKKLRAYAETVSEIYAGVLADDAPADVQSRFDRACAGFWEKGSPRKKACAKRAKAAVENACSGVRSAQHAYSQLQDGLAKQMLTGKDSMIKRDLLGMRTKESATLVLTGNGDLEIDQVRISPETAKGLGFEHPEDAEGQKVFVWRDPVLTNRAEKLMRITLSDGISGMAINPAAAKPLDADFDGDTLALLRVSPEEADLLEDSFGVRSFARDTQYGEVLEDGSVSAQPDIHLEMDACFAQARLTGEEKARFLDVKKQMAENAASLRALDEAYFDTFLERILDAENSSGRDMAHIMDDKTDGYKAEKRRIEDRQAELIEVFRKTVYENALSEPIAFTDMHTAVNDLYEKVVKTGAKGSASKLTELCEMAGMKVRSADGRAIPVKASHFTDGHFKDLPVIQDGPGHPAYADRSVQNGIDEATGVKNSAIGLSGRIGQKAACAFWASNLKDCGLPEEIARMAMRASLQAGQGVSQAIFAAKKDRIAAAHNERLVQNTLQAVLEGAPFERGADGDVCLSIKGHTGQCVKLFRDKDGMGLQTDPFNLKVMISVQHLLDAGSQKGMTARSAPLVVLAYGNDKDEDKKKALDAMCENGVHLFDCTGEYMPAGVRRALEKNGGMQPDIDKLAHIQAGLAVARTREAADAGKIPGAKLRKGFQNTPAAAGIILKDGAFAVVNRDGSFTEIQPDDGGWQF